MRIATPVFFCFPFAWNIFFPSSHFQSICVFNVFLFKMKKEATNLKNIRINKEGSYIMIKRSAQEEDIIVVYIYVPKIGAP